MDHSTEHDVHCVESEQTEAHILQSFPVFLLLETSNLLYLDDKTTKCTLSNDCSEEILSSLLLNMAMIDI